MLGSCCSESLLSLAHCETPHTWSPPLCKDLGSKDISTSGQSVSQFSHSVVSDSLQPHGLQHARLPCPSPTPGACSDSCPSSRWCHPTISSSVIPFSSCLPSIRVFPSESVLHKWPKYGCLSFSISPSNEYSGLISFRSDWFDLQCTPAHWTIQDRCSTVTMRIGPNSYSHQQVRISGSFTWHLVMKWTPV